LLGGGVALVSGPPGAAGSVFAGVLVRELRIRGVPVTLASSIGGDACGPSPDRQGVIVVDGATEAQAAALPSALRLRVGSQAKVFEPPLSGTWTDVSLDAVFRERALG
jgi:hypothetical protein